MKLRPIHRENESNGFTLVELMLVLGLLSFVGLIIAVMQTNVLNLQSNTASSMNFIGLQNKIQTILNNPEACSTLFKGQKFPLSSGTPADLPKKSSDLELTEPGSGRVFLKKDVAYSSFVPNEIELTSNLPPSVLKVGSTDYNFYYTELNINVKRTDKKDSPSRPLKFSINILTKASDNSIVRCDENLRAVCEKESGMFISGTNKCCFQDSADPDCRCNFYHESQFNTSTGYESGDTPIPKCDKPFITFKWYWNQNQGDKSHNKWDSDWHSLEFPSVNSLQLINVSLSQCRAEDIGHGIRDAVPDGLNARHVGAC